MRVWEPILRLQAVHAHARFIQKEVAIGSQTVSEQTQLNGCVQLSHWGLKLITSSSTHTHTHTNLYIRICPGTTSIYMDMKLKYIGWFQGENRE